MASGKYTFFLILLMSGFVRCQLDQCDSRAYASRLNTVERRITELDEMKASIQTLMESLSQKDEYRDAIFLVRMSSNIGISSSQVIKWNVAAINPGNHYSTVTGGYTAPYTGYYQFTVSIRTGDGSDENGHFFLLVDGQKYLYYDLYHTGAPTGTMTVNIKLNAGQIVQVQSRDSFTMRSGNSSGGIQSWFTGYLLYPL